MVFLSRNKGAITSELQKGRENHRWVVSRRGEGEGGRRPRQGLTSQLLPQGPDMSDTFILIGRTARESSEEETERITERS